MGIVRQDQHQTSNFLGICFTDECRQKKMEDECMKSCGTDECTKEQFDKCMEAARANQANKKDKTEKTVSTIEELLALVSKATHKNSTESTLPPTPSSSLVLGMQPGIAYTLIAVTSIAVIFGGYKLVKHYSK